MSATRAVNSPRAGAPDSPPAIPDPSAQETLDEQARKRVAVGLSPRRPTAKAAPQRPPDVKPSPVAPVLLVLALAAVVVVTALLVWASLEPGRFAWLTGRTTLAEPVAAEAPADPATLRYVLRLGDDFSSPQSVLRQGSLAGEWQIELLPEQSVLRMAVWPNRLAFSLLAADDLVTYRLQTSVALDSAATEGYAGLMVRYRAQQGFVLFAVDGRGQYSVQADGRDGLSVIQPWTPAPVLHPAPSTNLLTVEDRGDRIEFYANQSLLYVYPTGSNPGGFVGVAAGTNGPEVAEARFDWLQLYDIVASPLP